MPDNNFTFDIYKLRKNRPKYTMQKLAFMPFTVLIKTEQNPKNGMK